MTERTAGRARNPRLLLLWGPPAVGKSSVGRALASALGGEFIDLDDRVAERSGLPRDQLFARGEPFFREQESALLRELLREDDADCYRVIALGGGTLVDEELRFAALTRATVIALIAPIASLALRAQQGGRPLLEGDVEGKLARLLDQRREAYRAGHLVFSTEGAPELIAASIVKTLKLGLMPLTVDRQTSYAVELCNRAALRQRLTSLFAWLAPSSLTVISDDVVAPHHLSALLEELRADFAGPVRSLTRPAGETHKTFASLEQLLTQLHEARIDRRALLLGLGGGVTTDITGLAAALLSRGIAWVALPTSLMGMVDAATGGKTAVNLGAAKNGVGIFHHPRSVLVCTEFTTTEEDRAVKSGLAEVVKSACIADAALFAWLETHAAELCAREPAAMQYATRAALRVKTELVEKDPSESGPRRLLNFGHTFGHALEAATRYERWLHGEAVALGMAVALGVGVELGSTSREVCARVRQLLTALGLARGEALGLPLIEAAIAELGRDKKTSGSDVHFIVLRDIGTAEQLVVPLQELADRMKRAALERC